MPALVVLVAAASMTGCGGGASCASLPRAITFIGVAEAKHGTVVTFTVVDVPSANREVLATAGVGVPEVGETVAVNHDADAGWVDLGQRFAVSPWAFNGELGSGVRTPGEGDCASEGTRWDDGTPINTAIWTHRGLREVAPAIVILGLGIVVVVGLHALSRRWNRADTSA